MSNGNVCGPLCPHPSCWKVQRSSKPPKTAENTRESADSSYEPLPTQSVVNLFENVLPPSERRIFYEPTERLPTRTTGSRIPAPQATPAVGDDITLTSLETKRANQIIVHEVFELSDLRSSVGETFMPTSYLVWHPSKEKPKKPKTRKIIQNPLDVLPPAPPPHTAASSRQPTRVTRFRKSPSAGYRGLDDLLDLPRDILHQVVGSLSPNDLRDRKRLTSKLLTLVPQLERHSSAVALAASRVLTQHKMRIAELQTSLSETFSRSQTKPTVKLHRSDSAGSSDPDRTTIPVADVAKMLHKQKDVGRIVLDSNVLELAPKTEKDEVPERHIVLLKKTPDLDTNTESSLHVFTPETIEAESTEEVELTAREELMEKIQWAGETAKVADEDPSPVPPPPSPNALQTSAPSTANNNAAYIFDSDSEHFTISARPPTDLDDISRLQTPKTPSKKDLPAPSNDQSISVSNIMKNAVFALNVPLDQVDVIAEEDEEGLKNRFAPV
ncbi:unnamed protein product [Dimorphilus gyrociliatus]|uniref:F-box domain-containing protein n=1 Tax=Dimorphilus gyrociliatus TaxID=2664684 RepID=A0A7I8VUH2_9ANNE|nr:unnamed protein product [Dimorphilus gyrociliatus]